LIESLGRSSMMTFEKHLEMRKRMNSAPSTRLWSPVTEIVGLIGDWTIAFFFRAEPDQQWKPNGDGGRDIGALCHFWQSRAPGWFEFDGKASHFRPHSLAVDKTKIAPYRIYSLIGPVGDTYKCLKWDWGHVLMLHDPIFWGGVWAHCRDRDECQEMSVLREAYCGMWRHYSPDKKPMEPREALTDEELKPWFEELGRGIALLRDHERADPPRPPTYKSGSVSTVVTGTSPGTSGTSR
jgi:hypothetical protein